MPIDIEEFEAASPGELRGEERPVATEALEFLAYNPGYAYSREEIQSALGVDALHLLHELSHLERRGLVRHKGRYWAIAPDYDGESPTDEPPADDA